jgi:hypothetical protein
MKLKTWREGTGLKPEDDFSLILGSKAVISLSQKMIIPVSIIFWRLLRNILSARQCVDQIHNRTMGWCCHAIVLAPCSDIPIDGVYFGFTVLLNILQHGRIIVGSGAG